jgi:hypothetical protein
MLADRVGLHIALLSWCACQAGVAPEARQGGVPCWLQPAPAAHPTRRALQVNRVMGAPSPRSRAQGASGGNATHKLAAADAARQAAAAVAAPTNLGGLGLRLHPATARAQTKPSVIASRAGRSLCRAPLSPRVASLSQQLSRATSVRQLYALEGAREGVLVPGMHLNAKLRGLDSLRQRRPLSGSMSTGLGRQHSYAAYGELQQQLPPAEELLAGLEQAQESQRQGSAAAADAQRGSISFSAPSRQSFMGLPGGSRRASRRVGVMLPPPSAEASEQGDGAATSAAAAARRSGTKSSSEIKEELEAQLGERAAGLDDNWGLEVLVRVGCQVLLLLLRAGPPGTAEQRQAARAGPGC